MNSFTTSEYKDYLQRTNEQTRFYSWFKNNLFLFLMNLYIIVKNVNEFNENFDFPLKCKVFNLDQELKEKIVKNNLYLHDLYGIIYNSKEISEEEEIFEENQTYEEPFEQSTSDSSGSSLNHKYKLTSNFENYNVGNDLKTQIKLPENIASESIQNSFIKDNQSFENNKVYSDQNEILPDKNMEIDSITDSINNEMLKFYGGYSLNNETLKIVGDHLSDPNNKSLTSLISSFSTTSENCNEYLSRDEFSQDTCAENICIQKEILQNENMKIDNINDPIKNKQCNTLDVENITPKILCNPNNDGYSLNNEMLKFSCDQNNISYNDKCELSTSLINTLPTISENHLEHLPQDENSLNICNEILSIQYN